MQYIEKNANNKKILSTNPNFYTISADYDLGGGSYE